MALNKYDKQHLRNLTAYERQVDAIYRAAVKEAAFAITSSNEEQGIARAIRRYVFQEDHA